MNRDIIFEEVKKIVMNCKNNKPCGVDNVVFELLKYYNFRLW